MKLPLRQLIRQRDVEGLAHYCRETFGIAITEPQARVILDQAQAVGGPADQPWSDSTWKMWLKGKATQPPPPPTELQPATPARCDLATALDESSAFIASSGGFQVYRVAHWDGLEEEHPDEEWDELFPVPGALGVTLAKEFEARGGREFLGKAPFASWLLARLEYLGMGGVEEENDLGGYRTHFLLKSCGAVAGVIMIEAGSAGVEVNARGRSPGIGAEFISLLVQDTRAVARCELEVHGEEVGYTNAYGWTGEHFLGASNMTG